MNRNEAIEASIKYAYACGVDGHVAEFGCYLGESAELLAKAMRENEFYYGELCKKRGFVNRWLWLLDSFEGFPAATDKIDQDAFHVRTGEWAAGHMAGATPEHIRFACHRHISRVIVIGGWFKDSVAKLPHFARQLHDENPLFPPIAKFSVVHIDCDFYESTYQVLDALFEHKMLADGATILFDDWYCNRGSPSFGEQRAWADTVAKHDIKHSDWGPYDFAGRRFIVHER